MKRTLRTLTVTLSVVVATCAIAEDRTPVLTQLALHLETDKSVYLPGELVELRFRISPRSGPALAPARMSVEDGSLGLFVKRPPEGYLEYQGPGWGATRTSRLGAVMLSPDQSVESTGTLLYNAVPQTSHLSPMYRAAQEQGRILTAYALPQPGDFLLKAVYRSGYSDERLESDPVEISVHDPTGADLRVWKILRDKPRLGYLLQTGVLPGYASDADEDAALAVLRSIVRRHPSSAYTPRVRQQLEHFQKFVQERRRTRLGNG